MTETEALVWSEVRRRQFGCRIRRQEPIGPFVVDLVCKRHRWILEIDGSQHNDSSYDINRDRWLRARGYRIVRLWSHEVMADLEMVMRTIAHHAEEA